MPTVFEKLNLKDQKEIVILNAPHSFEPEIARLQNVKVCRSLDEVAELDFFMAFVTEKKDVNQLSLTAAKKARGDVIIWFVYPKGTSKKYQCDFNRDNGFDILYSQGYQPVRMVAIDTDWSALRIRRIEFSKKR
jgi:hypothetical protein